MKFGVVTFPGSNCDQDMVYVLETILNQEVVQLWHKDTDLQGCDFIVLPGGFSYGDYLRSGAIAKLSPIMGEVIKHANNGGYVMGICNGFQILTESGLLEGALLHNNSQKFICKNVYLKPATNDSAITKDLDVNATYQIPIAHGEGRFYADEATIQKLEDNNQILFRYTSKGGDTTEEFNPNGSINNIAGITNEGRNVFGMMPHPERAADEALANEDGKAFFESILAHCK
ncbi:phosphoribosylformylglycinamidine synthase subunit I [Lishizhenia tianjinensis]|uniref:Phosphoribosylformylglycinamidine synthase subunit PurQ n=1 Tax=Lishizhenia tianjinensis TaxID=477690 RepID=A0A1I7BF24_9FLAO|nr:phosphoribosylformylglycinamidine synthase subunit PurQ [Lishizhenia tianjinensis]SFT85758.1 phosphoribosylformylglycinamidine synthase subunit I [Lishizhenia tianjinensis]